MAMTPARAHMLAVTAASMSADDSGAHALDPAQTSAYELMQAQLYEHRRALKAIQSIERKVEAKRAYLPLYWPWVDGVLVGGLYFVNIGRMCFGESMFSHRTDASKIALAALVAADSPTR